MFRSIGSHDRIDLYRGIVQMTLRCARLRLNQRAPSDDERSSHENRVDQRGIFQ